MVPVPAFGAETANEPGHAFWHATQIWRVKPAPGVAPDLTDWAIARVAGDCYNS